MTVVIQHTQFEHPDIGANPPADGIPVHLTGNLRMAIAQAEFVNLREFRCNGVVYRRSGWFGWHYEAVEDN